MLNIQSSTSSALSQLQRVQAQRSAEQAEARAAALAQQAASARSEADSADRRAQSLERNAGQAQTVADQSRLAVKASDGLQQMGEKLQSQVNRVAQAVTAQDGSASSTVFTRTGETRAATPPQTGSVVDVFA